MFYNNIDPRLLFLLRRVCDVSQGYLDNVPIRLLDVGCADGSFMSAAKKHFNKIDSIEGVDVPSGWFKSNISRVGTVYMQDLQEGTGDIPLHGYNVVTLWEVIEHVENVYGFLNNIKKLMAPGGILLMSTPNLLGLSRFVKGKNWIGVLEKDHKYLFDKLSLAMLLTKVGMSNVKVVNYFFPSLGEKFDYMNKIMSAFPGGGMLFAEALSC